jgi:hypothetical protein
MGGFHWMWWPAIGAIAVGVTGYFAPRTMGVGYDNIQDLLKGSLPYVYTTAILKYYSYQKQEEHNYDSPKRTQKIMVHGRKLVKKMGK